MLVGLQFLEEWLPLTYVGVLKNVGKIRGNFFDRANGADLPNGYRGYDGPIARSGA